jgi:hypothetical protein
MNIIISKNNYTLSSSQDSLTCSGLKALLYRMGHEKVARVRSQQHAIEDGQRWGGGGGGAKG